MARHRAAPDRRTQADPATTTGAVPSPRRAPDDDSRTAWVDAAKGLCIALVVLHHVVMFLKPHGLVPAPLDLLNTALASLRMPLFFLASGLFLASALDRPWRVMAHRRVALFAWLYLLWTTAQFALFAVLPTGTAPATATQSATGLLLSPVVPAPSLWFLYALAVFSLAARLLRRVPAAVLLVVTAVSSAFVGAGTVEIGSFGWEFMARYAFFFVLGWHGRRLVGRLASATSPPRVLAGGLLAGAAAAAAVLLGVRDVPGVAFALNLLAVGVGVLLAAEIVRWRAGRVVVALGRATLPIYLTNVLVIGGLTALTAVLTAGWPLPAVAQYAVVGLVAAVTVVATLGVHRLLLAARCGWLYDLPGRWAVRSGHGGPARPAPRA
ncbi:acyltransferase-like protein [Pseudonocardia sediminis]|uniref:Acyltransferase-like protein n=1 Tax=Pseudonocardia sediminis TaxID=1397368 RepID=A0A4Q7UX47_PSEST|nr:acyltransferase family protein [Pseudonocardia sediminis]RZT84763.1 acyltransferase-like protein [Pseudonocardia sediminis]